MITLFFLKHNSLPHALSLKDTLLAAPFEFLCKVVLIFWIYRHWYTSDHPFTFSLSIFLIYVWWVHNFISTMVLSHELLYHACTIFQFKYRISAKSNVSKIKYQACPSKLKQNKEPLPPLLKKEKRKQSYPTNLPQISI